MKIGPPYDPETDGSPETDDDHDFWTIDGIPIQSAWLAAGLPIPEGNWGAIAETHLYNSAQPRATTTTTSAHIANAVTRQSVATPGPIAQPGVSRDRPGGGITR